LVLLLYMPLFVLMLTKHILLYQIPLSLPQVKLTVGFKFRNRIERLS